MSRGTKSIDGAPRRQGDLLGKIFRRIMQVRRRAAVIEGKDPGAEGVITRATIDGFRDFVDDTNPRADHLREQFWGDLERHIDRLSLRVDRTLKITPAERRQRLRSRFRRIDGGRRG